LPELYSCQRARNKETLKASCQLPYFPPKTVRPTGSTSSQAVSAWFGGGAGKFGEVNQGDPMKIKEFEDSLISVFWGTVEFDFVFDKGINKRKVTWVHKF
jgi:hypothetical protein